MIVLKALALLAGYAVAVLAGGAFVDAALDRLQGPEDREDVEAFRRRGLRGGGRVIGWLERFLFVTFVLAGSYGALGFVLGAKGVVRFAEIKDAKDQKVAEYVLVGTLLSLAWAVVVGLGLRWLIFGGEGGG
ncbi:MAG: hypothetical protein HZB55_08855 [Deltaproteobacteria bacterium]|nr:hypothetical protein [Deltaproteobacteria bacterium]